MIQKRWIRRKTKQATNQLFGFMKAKLGFSREIMFHLFDIF